MHIPANVNAVPVGREQAERRDTKRRFDGGSGECFRSPVGAAADTKQTSDPNFPKQVSAWGKTRI